MSIPIFSSSACHPRQPAPVEWICITDTQIDPDRSTRPRPAIFGASYETWIRSKGQYKGVLLSRVLIACIHRDARVQI